MGAVRIGHVQRNPARVVKQGITTLRLKKGSYLDSMATTLTSPDIKAFGAVRTALQGLGQLSPSGEYTDMSLDISAPANIGRNALWNILKDSVPFREEKRGYYAHLYSALVGRLGEDAYMIDISTETGVKALGEEDIQNLRSENIPHIATEYLSQEQIGHFSHSQFKYFTVEQIENFNPTILASVMNKISDLDPIVDQLSTAFLFKFLSALESADKTKELSPSFLAGLGIRINLLKIDQLTCSQWSSLSKDQVQSLEFPSNMIFSAHVLSIIAGKLSKDQARNLADGNLTNFPALNSEQAFAIAKNLFPEQRKKLPEEAVPLLLLSLSRNPHNGMIQFISDLPDAGIARFKAETDTQKLLFIHKDDILAHIFVELQSDKERRMFLEKFKLTPEEKIALQAKIDELATIQRRGCCDTTWA